MNQKIQEIDRKIAALKGERTEELKGRLFECYAEVVALNNLLFNKTARDLPFPMPTEEAAKFRARVNHFINGELPIAKQVSALRHERNQLNVSG